MSTHTTVLFRFDDPDNVPRFLAWTHDVGAHDLADDIIVINCKHSSFDEGHESLDVSVKRIDPAA